MIRDIYFPFINIILIFGQKYEKGKKDKGKRIRQNSSKRGKNLICRKNIYLRNGLDEVPECSADRVVRHLGPVHHRLDVPNTL